MRAQVTFIRRKRRLESAELLGHTESRFDVRSRSRVPAEMSANAFRCPPVLTAVQTAARVLRVFRGLCPRSHPRLSPPPCPDGAVHPSVGPGDLAKPVHTHHLAESTPALLLPTL